MIEILAKNHFNFKETCESIDFISYVIENSCGKVRKKEFTKVYKEIFLLFKRIPINEREDVKNKLRKYFINFKNFKI
jgi:hypothetical protein